MRLSHTCFIQSLGFSRLIVESSSGELGGVMWSDGEQLGSKTVFIFLAVLVRVRTSLGVVSMKETSSALSLEGKSSIASVEKFCREMHSLYYKSLSEEEFT